MSGDDSAAFPLSLATVSGKRRLDLAPMVLVNRQPPSSPELKSCNIVELAPLSWKPDQDSSTDTALPFVQLLEKDKFSVPQSAESFVETAFLPQYEQVATSRFLAQSANEDDKVRLVLRWMLSRPTGDTQWKPTLGRGDDTTSQEKDAHQSCEDLRGDSEISPNDSKSALKKSDNVLS
ncbi:hypothetical protein K461DRAFT_314298 [Myriangium duriaei CBS 260.36]|uniref:Uncharacterized protein n=1 Tax=Myriangium duriaei CBS 260.36 TaxID=1168546 RepID=A0A9P4IYV1_9PEZI|nr:hypothetical protein K461DRAFT_314298 [Myriangium duriaei CBS 260.36]